MNSSEGFNKISDLQNSCNLNATIIEDASEPFAELYHYNSQETHQLFLPETTLGRSPYCSIIVRDVMFSRSQSIFRKTNDNKCLFENKGANETIINIDHLPQNESKLLKSGDIIRIADKEFFKFSYIEDGKNISVFRENSTNNARPDLDERNEILERIHNITEAQCQYLKTLSEKISQLEENTNTNREISEIESQALNTNKIYYVNLIKLREKLACVEKKIEKMRLPASVNNLKRKLDDSSEELKQEVNQLKKELEEEKKKNELLVIEKKRLDHILNDQKENDNQILRSLECPVCLEVCIDVVVTNCKHHFCKHCIQNIKCCPICRNEIKEFSKNPLLFKLIDEFVQKKMTDEKKCERLSIIKNREQRCNSIANDRLAVGDYPCSSNDLSASIAPETASELRLPIPTTARRVLRSNTRTRRRSSQVLPQQSPDGSMLITPTNILNSPPFRGRRRNNV